MGYVICILVGFSIGVIAMSLLHTSAKTSVDERVAYLKRIKNTNAKGKSEYDKGYTAGIEYAYTVFEEEI